MSFVYNWGKKPQLEDGCGGSIYKVLDVDNSPLKELELALCFFKPGEKSTPHHHNQMEEAFYILEGHGIIEIGGQKITIGREDAVAIPKGFQHMIFNTSQDEQLVFLSINSPRWLPEDMILS